MADTLENTIKKLALDGGADLVGIGTRERLIDSPPSGEPASVLPSARSVISFAVAMDQEAARAFKEWFQPGDVAIFGIVDHVDLYEEEKA